METLYRRLLGDRFAGLHPVLRRFHSAPRGGTLTGWFRVSNPARRFRKLLAGLLRFPPAGDSVELRLEVIPSAGGERWVRSFGGRPLVTFQTARRGRLVERTGPLRFELAVDVTDGGMRFRTERVWLLGLPLPRWCAPSVGAAVVPDDRGWVVTVRLALPGLGPVLGYEGEVVPRWNSLSPCC